MLQKKLLVRRNMYLCKRWIRENTYSSFKSIGRPVDLYIILFDKHSPFQKSVVQFCRCKYIIGDVLDKYVQRYQKLCSTKTVFYPIIYIIIFTKRIYDGVEAETRKSQASFQITRVSSEAENEPEISSERPQHHH